MPPNEPCPHCGELILDWHNEWYEVVVVGCVKRTRADAPFLPPVRRREYA